jgi:lia operon protein LiaF
MSAPHLEPQPRFAGPRVAESLGTIVIGAAFVLAGLVWLLNLLDVVSLTIGFILPLSLVLVGVSLVILSISGSHRGLIVLGVLLTLILTIATAADVPLSGGFGDHHYATNQLTEVQNRYQLAIGNLEVDLSRVSFVDGVTTVSTRVGIGELVVYVPRDVAVQVHWTVAAGNVDVLGVNRNGTSLDDRIESPGYSNASKKIMIEATMGFGDIQLMQR